MHKIVNSSLFTSKTLQIPYTLSRKRIKKASPYTTKENIVIYT